MDKDLIVLIKVVNDNYNHIAQLDALEKLLNKPETKEEFIICKTTHNSHYGYRYMGHRKYQDAANHVDNFIKTDGHWLSYNGQQLTIVENGEQINWDKEG